MNTAAGPEIKQVRNDISYRRWKIAIIGDRGIPACYSGFSTLVEQLATRLVDELNFEVTVYCRSNYYDEHPAYFKGVRCVYFDAPGGKSWESIIHSNLAIMHAAFQDYDLAFVLDPGNGPFILPLLVRRMPTLIHTDGMGWMRQKWSPIQQKYYKWSEWVSARLASWLVTDSRAMQAYYRSEYQADSCFIPYAGEIGGDADESVLEEHGLIKNEYYLVVARIEPENNLHLIIQEYKKADVTRPLVVVGAARYDTSYGRMIADSTGESVMCIGAVYDPPKLNSLFEHCYVYFHGHSVGGTNPSLLNAMHMGAAAVPIDIEFHREVLGDDGLYFGQDDGHLAALIQEIETDQQKVVAVRKLAKERSDTLYRWDAVAAGYAELFRKMLEAKNSKQDFGGASSEVYRPWEFIRSTSIERS